MDASRGPEADAAEAPQPQNASEAAQPHPQQREQEGEESGNGEGSGPGPGSGPDDEDEDEKLLSTAQKLMEKITSSQDNPNPNFLHALASIMETEESRSLSLSLYGHFFPCCTRLGCMCLSNQ